MKGPAIQFQDRLLTPLLAVAVLLLPLGCATGAPDNDDDRVGEAMADPGEAGAEDPVDGASDDTATPLTDDLEGQSDDDRASGASGTSGGAYGTGGSGSGPSTTGATGSVSSTAMLERMPTPDGTVAGAGEIAGVRAAIHRGEVAAGQLAGSRALDPAVQGFATRMVNEHSAGIERVEALADAARPSELSTAVEQQARAVIAELQSLSGAELDHAYVQSQIAMHSSALRILDERLLAAANGGSGSVGDLLRAARSDIAGHLESARSLASRLDGR